MRTLEIPNLPEPLYQQIERLARLRGRPVGDVAAEFLARGIAATEAAEETLLAEIRAEREEMARRGVFLTDEDIRRAKGWGRE